MATLTYLFPSIAVTVMIYYSAFIRCPQIMHWISFAPYCRFSVSHQYFMNNTLSFDEDNGMAHAGFNNDKSASAGSWY